MPGQMVPQGASSGVSGALGIMLPFLLHLLPLQSWMNTSFSGNHSQSLSFSSHPQLKNKAVSALSSIAHVRLRWWVFAPCFLKLS